jgi:hypothetical protein
MTTLGICSGCSSPVAPANDSGWRAAHGDPAQTPAPVCASCWSAFTAKPPRGTIVPADAECSLCGGSVAGLVEDVVCTADGAPGTVYLLHDRCVRDRFPLFHRPASIDISMMESDIREPTPHDDTRSVGFVLGPAAFTPTCRKVLNTYYVAIHRPTERIVAGGSVQGMHNLNSAEELAHCVYPMNSYIDSTMSFNLHVARGKTNVSDGVLVDVVRGLYLVGFERFGAGRVWTRFPTTDERMARLCELSGANKVDVMRAEPEPPYDTHTQVWQVQRPDWLARGEA